MRLTMKARQEVTKATAGQYRGASKKEKGKILDQFIATTGYSRWYARLILRHEGRRVQTDKQTIVVVERKSRTKRKRARCYDEKVQTALVKLWRIMDYLCGKRLQPMLPELLAILERHNEFRCERETRAKLLRISAASIDRLLKPERRKYELRGRSGTKPGTLLKKQIPIRTFAEWDEQCPGFVEIDLVAHDGGLAAGDYCQTLDLTDIATTWTETLAVRNKAQAWVFAALKEMRQKLCWASIVTTAPSSSTSIWWNTVRNKNSASPARDRIAKTTTVLSSRRTTPWCGVRWATHAMTRKHN